MQANNHCKSEWNRLMQAISSANGGVSFGECISKLKEMNTFFEQINLYIQKSNVVIKDLNKVIALLKEHEEEMKEHADCYAELIRHKPKKVRDLGKWLLGVVLSKKERKKLEEVQSLILQERYELNKELYKVNESFLNIENLDWKIEVLRQAEVEMANNLIVKLNHAKEENKVILTLNQTISERMR